MSGAPLLAVDGLTVDYATPSGRRAGAAATSTFRSRKGEALALVGESGSGKSTIALATWVCWALRPRIARARSCSPGKDLARMPPRNSARLRGNRHQHGLPGSVHLAEPGPARRPAGGRTLDAPSGAIAREAAMERAVAALAEVGLPRPAELMLGLSPSAQRRHAAARADRYRAGLRSRTDHT